MDAGVPAGSPVRRKDRRWIARHCVDGRFLALNSAPDGYQLLAGSPSFVRSQALA
jgi:hypothetical protein